MLHLPALTERAEKMLSTAGDPSVWRLVKADIEAGRSQLFLCPNDTYIVLSIGDDMLIFCAMAGCDAVEAVRAVINIAYVKGISTVRFQSARKGMARLLSEFKPVVLQTYYEINVNENQH